MLNACICNDIKEVKQRLLQGEDPTLSDNLPIRIVSQYGRLEIVKLLMADSRVDPSGRNNEAILLASQQGHVDVVRLLLTDPRVDPFADNNWAIRQAKENGHTEIVQLLTEHQYRLDGPIYNKNIL